MQPSITHTEYRAFQRAYDFFNAELFEGSLPPVLVTLQRKANARGYFSPDRFTGRTERGSAHELAMNPDCFTGRSDEGILSTLVHEMVHVWQETYGNKPTRCYHDRHFAAKMIEIGLQPSNTGEPGGKQTGQKMTHYIIGEGRYARGYAKLSSKGFHLNWQSTIQGKLGRAKAESKSKFSCLQCGQNAWAKATAKLICGICCETGAAAVVPMTLVM